MTLENELLSIERTLWAAEAEAYRRNLDDRCPVAFTQMAGVSSREIRSASNGPSPSASV